MATITFTFNGRNFTETFILDGTDNLFPWYNGFYLSTYEYDDFFRIWSGNYDHHITVRIDDIKAIDQNGNVVPMSGSMILVHEYSDQSTQPWTPLGLTHAIDVSKFNAWRTLVITFADKYGQTASVELVNNRFFYTQTFVEDFRDIFIIHFREGNNQVLQATVDNIVLTVDGKPANIRNYTNNVAGHQVRVPQIQIRKNLPWKEMTLEITENGQTVVHTFINNRFLSTTIFAEPTRESVNIRFFQGTPQVALNIPLENIKLIADGVEVENIRDYTINIANWQTETNTIFISKLKQPWQSMVVEISAFGQTLRYEYVNNMYVPE
jgi:hypothetical protein